MYTARACLSPEYYLNPAMAQSFSTLATGRAVNTGFSSDTIAAGVASTYESANTSSGAFTVTLAAPIGDGERRRICFKNAIGAITWSFTSPATAVTGAPTTLAAGGCVELVYQSVFGAPLTRLRQRGCRIDGGDHHAAPQIRQPAGARKTGDLKAIAGEQLAGGITAPELDVAASP